VKQPSVEPAPPELFVLASAVGRGILPARNPARLPGEVTRVNPNRFVRTVLSAISALCVAAALPARAAEEHGGAGYKRTLGNVGLVLDADLDLAVNKRGERALGVKDILTLGAEGQFQIASGLAAFGTIAWQKPLQEASGVDIGAEFTFENLLGKHSTADERSGRVFLRLFM
jgi:hypothetical protein